MLKKAIAALALSALMSVSAHAGLSKIDWKTEGDNRIVLDSDTGIEWLPLSNTLGMSIDQVSAELGPGGQYEGWRLPTAKEVEGLMTTIYPAATNQFSNDGSQTVSGYNWYTGGSDYYASYRTAWSNWMGLTYYTTGHKSTYKRYWQSYGLYMSDNPDDPSLADEDVLMSGFAYQKHNTTTSRSYKYYYYIYSDRTGYSTSTKNGNTGVYLVNDGGVSLSSIEDPKINGANPNSPYRTPVGGAAIAFMGLLFGRLKKAKVTASQ